MNLWTSMRHTWVWPIRLGSFCHFPQLRHMTHMRMRPLRVPGPRRWVGRSAFLSTVWSLSCRLLGISLSLSPWRRTRRCEQWPMCSWWICLSVTCSWLCFACLSLLCPLCCGTSFLAKKCAYSLGTYKVSYWMSSKGYGILYIPARKFPCKFLGIKWKTSD